MERALVVRNEGLSEKNGVTQIIIMKLRQHLCSDPRRLQMIFGAGDWFWETSIG
jgi:hypothetical protein